MGDVFLVGYNISTNLLYMLLGVSIVLIILAIILIGISLFGFVLKLEKRETLKQMNHNEDYKGRIDEYEKDRNLLDNSIIEEIDDKDYIDDKELVAVITAAIMASLGEEAPKDGLVVKSIHKVNKQSWQIG